MPSGCEFVCENEDCKCCGSGFTMHDFWPVVKIDDILNIQNEVELPEGFIEAMEKRKKDGREFCLVPYPIPEGVEPLGVRVQLWCSEPPSIIDEDIDCEYLPDLLEEKGEKVLTMIVSTNGFTKEKDGVSLKTYRDCLFQGILCPHCGEKMGQSNWFVHHK